MAAILESGHVRTLIKEDKRIGVAHSSPAATQRHPPDAAARQINPCFRLPCSNLVFVLLRLCYRIYQVWEALLVIDLLLAGRCVGKCSDGVQQ